MSYTLDEVKQIVRTTLDVDSEELVDLLLETWCREAAGRVQNAHPRWPFLKHRWTLPTVADTQTYDLDDLGTSATNRVRSISMVEVAGTRRLRQISPEVAATSFTDTSGSPGHWYVENDVLYLWPTPSDVEELTLHGVRQFAKWVDGENGGEIDLPEEMHGIIVNWVLGRAYQQQDDFDAGVMYLDMADEELRRWVRRPPGGEHGEAIVMGGGTRVESAWEGDHIRFPFE